jgi:uncharacterized protein (TIGR03435 family)
VYVTIAALAAQSPDPGDWQTAAGGKMSFEVASVKPTTLPRIASFPLDSRNAYVPGGRFSASFPLRTFISFAYKLEGGQTRQLTVAQLPKWLSTDFFEIEARTEGNPTKDQMRLMMQSLLADRFQLAIHFETREGPIFALTLAKPGQMGPKLLPHSEGPPCPDTFVTTNAPPKPSEAFPRTCGTAPMSPGKEARLLIGSRDTTMPSLADALYGYGRMAGEVDRPIIDKSGLGGTFDFTLEYTPGDNDQLRGPGPPNPDAPPPSSDVTPFLNAMREQLDLKLVPTKGPIKMIVIDHVERPSAN